MALSRWKTEEIDAGQARRLAAETQLGDLAARVLLARGYRTAEQVRAFLNADTPLEDPLNLKDMDAAAARIRLAIEREQRIAVFGDYDVDGITATTLMVQFLLGCGGDVICALPARDETGYGISCAKIDQLKEYGAGLIVTVDNGVSACDEIAYAASLGIDVVVCDHHLPPAQLPKAVAVVDPLRADDTSGFKALSGVGVALKLAAAVEGCAAEDMMESYGYLAAMGTIADIMPLTGENRAIVAAGLEQIRSCDSPGLRALCAACGLEQEALDAHKVAFSLAPRLNAAGRMGSADLALALLLSEDEEEAAGLAEQLLELNMRRREAEQEILARVAGILARNRALLHRPIAVIAAEDLHAGVIGIVCSRLVEMLGKPVVMISIEGGEAKGSGRSVAGFSLHDAVAACSGLLLKFGGHEMAAGFTLKAEDVPAFTEELCAFGAARGLRAACPELRIDAEVDPGEITEAAVAGLAALEPFGCANEQPLFAARGLVVGDVVPLGEGHSRVSLRRGGGTITGAYFGVRPEDFPFQTGDRVDAAMALSIYSAKYKDMVSVRFKELRPAQLDTGACESVTAYEDFRSGFVPGERARGLIALSRDDVGAVYRMLRGHTVNRADYAEIAGRFPGLLPGRAAAAIDILEELGLVELQAGPGCALTARARANPVKNDLVNSSLYVHLNGEGSL